VPSRHVEAADAVLVRGVNLVPRRLADSVAAAHTRVWLTPGTTAAANDTPVTVTPTAVTPAAVSFTMPPDVPDGVVGLVIVGPGAVPSQEFSIEAHSGST
jgi:hypothetical protein